ncbi:MAG: hypothetical protein ACREP6_04740 [Candidatus Binataceae bacterium]
MNDRGEMAADIGTPAGAYRLAASVDALVAEMLREQSASREIIERRRGELAFIERAISSISQTVGARLAAVKAQLGVELDRHG